MNDDHLANVSDVIDALGGNTAVAEKTKNAISAISNWRRANKFPPNTYILINGELNKIGKTAPSSLWNMRVAEASS